ncbi:cyclin2 related protein [Toxoplasma gondii ARI]|uniref:Cyclin2 related protein n=2 Tax=Toxoplasma gondii TaxID=5811 RepID=A0A139Y3S1_TOXGO|nr:cyclin2 related protein [Toxoplasma gondii ARI]
MDGEGRQEGAGAQADGGSSYASGREQGYTSVSTYDRQMGAEACSTDDSFVPSLATVLHHLVSISPPGLGEITSFHAIKEPQISIHDYLDRIAKYFGCSNECFVLSLVYIDRIIKLHRNFNVSILNIHRLLITSVMLAAKFFDDVYYSNKHYARVGGVRTREMNLLETQFLTLINYHLYVSPQEYDQYRRNVLAAVHYARHLTPSPLASNRLSSSQSSTSTASSSVSQAANALGNNGACAPSQALTNAERDPTSALSDSGAGGSASGASASVGENRSDYYAYGAETARAPPASRERSLRTESSASSSARSRDAGCLDSRSQRRWASQDAESERRSSTVCAAASSRDAELANDAVSARRQSRGSSSAVGTQDVEHEMEDDDEDTEFAEEGVAYGDGNQVWVDDLNAEEELYGEAGCVQDFAGARPDDEWECVNGLIAAEKNDANETPVAECGHPSVGSYGNRFHPSSQPFRERGEEGGDVESHTGKYGYFCGSAPSTKVSFSTASLETLASPSAANGRGAGGCGVGKSGSSTPSVVRAAETRSASAGHPACREGSGEATQASPAVFFSPAQATGCCRQDHEAVEPNAGPALQDRLRVETAGRDREEAATREARRVTVQTRSSSDRSRDGEERVMEVLEVCSSRLVGSTQPACTQATSAASAAAVVVPGTSAPAASKDRMQHPADASGSARREGGAATTASRQACLTPSGDGTSSASTASGASGGTAQSSVSSCLTPSQSVHSSPDVSMEEETAGGRLSATATRATQPASLSTAPRLARSFAAAAHPPPARPCGQKTATDAGASQGDVEDDAAGKAKRAPAEETGADQDKSELERVKPRDGGHVHWIEASDFAGGRAEFLALGGGAAPHGIASCRKGSEHEAPTTSFNVGLSSLSAGLAPAGASRGLCFSFGPCS